MIWSALAALALLLAIAPLVPAVAATTRARLTGRLGPPLLQLYWDLARLWRKGVVYSHTTTWIFRVAPIVLVATAALAACLLPLDGRRALLSFSGDFVAFAYLLALGRFVLVLAALDTGSAFEGMGAAREVSFASLAEPALFLCLLVLARATGTLSLSGMLGPGLPAAWTHAAPALVLAAIALFVVALAENARIPVDDPNTHLELTMIHEVMVLDHSGPALGLIVYGAAIKLFVFTALVLGALLPFTGDAWTDWLVFVAGALGTAVLLGVVESTMARLRLLTVPKLLVSASLLTAFAIVFELHQ